LKTLIIISLIFFPSTCLYSQILVYGDSRSNENIHKEIIKKITNCNPVAVFNTGDLVFWSQSKDNWKSFIDATADLRSKVPYYPVLGNHEKNLPNFIKFSIYQTMKHGIILQFRILGSLLLIQTKN